MIKKTFILICLALLGCSKQDDAVLEAIDEEMNVYSFSYDNKKYEIIKESKTWLDAVSYALNRGGYLAEINDQAEQNAIYSELTSKAGIVLDNTNNQFNYAAIWLGGNDLDNEGAWVWDGDNDKTSTQFWSGGIDGTPVNGLYSNWGNEPDNNGDQDALCIGIEATPINAAGKWTDLDGSKNQLFFVIEYN